MEQLFFSDGEIILSGKIVPGIMTRLSVRGEIRFDEQDIDGASGKKRLPQGWEDAAIRFDVVLTTDEKSNCYDKLTLLSAMFTARDKNANPKIYTVVNRHLAARGIRQVIFSSLDTAEDDRTDEIQANLSFEEYNPPVVHTEQAKAAENGKKKTEAEKAADEKSENPKDAEEVLEIDIS